MQSSLQSRIPYTVYCQDYASDHLYNTAEKDPAFGNAGYVRNVLEKAESMKSDRIDIMDVLQLSDENLFQLTPEDFSSIITVKESAYEKKIGFY